MPAYLAYLLTYLYTHSPACSLTQVRATLHNVGARAAAETAQLYLGLPAAAALQTGGVVAPAAAQGGPLHANASTALAADAAGRLRAVLWLDDDGGHYLHQALSYTPNPIVKPYP